MLNNGVLMTVIIGSFLHERSFNGETYWHSLINEEVESVYFESLSYNMLCKHKYQMYLITVEEANLLLTAGVNM